LGIDNPSSEGIFMVFLGIFGPPDVSQLKMKKDVHGLIKALNHKNDSTIRKNAMEVLAELGAYAVDPLIAALEDNDQDIRIGAASVLGHIGDTRPVNHLIAFLFKEENWIAQKTAIHALGRIKNPRLIDTLDTVLKENKYSNVWKNAAEVLGDTGDPRAVDILLSALDCDDRFLRPIVIEALGKIGDSRAIDPLINVLEDQNGRKEGSLEAIKVLGVMKDPKAINPLIQVLKDTDQENVTNAIINSLGNIGEPAVTPLIVAIKNNEIKENSGFSALKKIGESSREPLILAMKDNDFLLSKGERALYTLGSLPKANNNYDQEIARYRAILQKNKLKNSLLNESKDSPDEWGRERAVKELGKIGDSDAVDLLILALNDKGRKEYEWENYDRKYDDGSVVRRQAAVELGNIGNLRAIDPLIRALADNDEKTRENASIALEKLGWKSDDSED